MDRKMSGISYANGSKHHDFQYTNLVDLLESKAMEHPLKIAHVFHESSGDSTSNRTEVTFKQLVDKSLQYATALMDKGIKPGDRVAILGSNCPEYLYLDYAILRINALLIRVPVNFVYPGVLATLLKQYKCKALILGPGNNGEMLQTIDRIFPGIVSDLNSCKSDNALDDLNYVYALKPTENNKGLKSLDDLPENIDLVGAVREIQQNIDPDLGALTFPTSGSTGVPKFVLHSQFSLINNHTMTLGESMNLIDPCAVYFSDRPFSWFASFTFLPALFGISMVHLDMGVTFSGNKTRFVYEIMDQEKVTAATALAYFLHDALELQEKHNIPPPKSLQYILTGGERVPSDLLNFCKKAFKSTSHGYGSTECFLSSFGTILKNQDATSLYKLHPLPNIEMKVVNEDKIVVPICQIGTLMIRSPFNFLKYLDNPDASTETKTPTGWVDIKDISIMDENGRVEILGRTRDVISKGMTKIYPKTIENVLYQHKQVYKAIVIAVPDPRMFNEICACVIPKETLTTEELDTFCRNSFMGDDTSFVPKYYMIINEYPHTSTGKVDKKILLQMAIERFNIQDS